ncbi:MAG TPA: glycosyltransferase family 2 protein, partial [Ignavibacteria bacterium]|nr:glycosyltransferase family 2 protein [Ignavibacteria bacterium]
MKIFVIIPAINEELSIGKVLDDIPRDNVSEIIVVDNGSSDGTIAAAENAGGTVLIENNPGYGNACLKGMEHVYKREPSDNDIIVFLDGDYSDYPGEMTKIVKPVIEEDKDMVLGSRILGMKEGLTEDG